MLNFFQNTKLIKHIHPDIVVFLNKIILALIILLCTHFLVVILRHFIFAKMEKRQAEKAKRLKNLIPMDRALIPILRGIMTVILYTIGICISLEAVGLISKSSILALFGSMGLGAGFAVKDVVSNAVSGITLLASRSFKLDDYIECNGSAGNVKEISVLTTKLETADGILVAIPNNTMCTNAIMNYSKNKIRRLVITLSISHKESLEKITAMLHRIVSEDTRFLKSPPPKIIVLDIQSNAVQVQLRAWVTSDNYWDTYYDNMKKVKDTATAENINLNLPTLMQTT